MFIVGSTIFIQSILQVLRNICSEYMEWDLGMYTAIYA